MRKRRQLVRLGIVGYTAALMSNILLGVGASVSVYKACDLASKLSQGGHTVRVVLTRRAAELVNPQLFEAVTGERAYTDEFDRKRESAMDHIALAQWAECFVVAPLTANLAAELAQGFARDLVTTCALALAPDVPRLVAPAMNPTMLQNPAVQRNLETLRADGWSLLEPDAGHMACGDDGKGRLPETATIQARIQELLG